MWPRRRATDVVAWLCLVALLAGVVTLWGPPQLLSVVAMLAVPVPSRVAHVADPVARTASVALETVGARPPPLA